jgi:hypothetical protein
MLERKTLSVYRNVKRGIACRGYVEPHIEGVQARSVLAPSNRRNGAAKEVSSLILQQQDIGRAQLVQQGP